MQNQEISNFSRTQEKSESNYKEQIFCLTNFLNEEKNQLNLAFASEKTKLNKAHNEQLWAQKRNMENEKMKFNKIINDYKKEIENNQKRFNFIIKENEIEKSRDYVCKFILGFILAIMITFLGMVYCIY